MCVLASAALSHSIHGFAGSFCSVPQTSCSPLFIKEIRAQRSTERWMYPRRMRHADMTQWDDDTIQEAELLNDAFCRCSRDTSRDHRSASLDRRRLIASVCSSVRLASITTHWTAGTPAVNLTRPLNLVDSMTWRETAGFGKGAMTENVEQNGDTACDIQRNIHV